RVEAAGPGIHTVILAAEPITDVDTTAADELVDVDDWLARRDIRLVIAEMKDPVVDVLRDYGLTGRFTPDRFAPTVGAAVDDVTGTLRTDLEGTKWERDDGEDGGGGRDGNRDADGNGPERDR
ncbi:MAG TPA: sodium-independent anion transporter, partial [Agromyces sp.]|nr:sodium-independent anion transporter [Agromyces sp.]